VDDGLKRIGRFGRLPTKVLEPDLPNMAFALTAAIRGQAAVTIVTSRSVKFVRLSGPTFEYLFPDWVWMRVNALILDGSLDPIATPVGCNVRSIDIMSSSVSLLRSRDPLYRRVLLCLTETFPSGIGENND